MNNPNYNNNNNSTSNNPAGYNTNVNRSLPNNLSSPHPGLNLNPSSLTPQQQQILQQAHLIQQQQAILQQQHQGVSTPNHPIPPSLPQSQPPPSQQQQQQQQPLNLHSNQQQISQHQAMLQQQQLMLQQQQRQMPRNPAPQLPQQPNPSSIPSSQNIKRPMPAYNDVVGPNHAYNRAKRTKPTDRRLPDFKEADEGFMKLKTEFDRLQSMEEKIDWTISRKRLELEDSLKKTLSVKRTMRIKIWNSVEGQSWQKPAQEPQQQQQQEEEGEKDKEVTEEAKEKDEEKVEGGEEGPKKGAEEGAEGGDDKGEEAGESNREKIEQKEKETKEINMSSSIEAVPKWTLHIEGMLLDHSTSSEAKESLPKIIEAKRPFSSLITGLLIKVERPDDLYPEPNFVEWQKRGSSNPTSQFSEFKFTRTGSEKCKLQLAFHLDQCPQRLKLMPILGDFLDLREGTLSEIMDAIWTYIKKERLQDSIDKRHIKKDQKLACLFPPMCDKMPFHQLTDSVRRFIGMSEPVRIEYEIDVEEGCEEKAKYYDVEFNIEDPAKLHMMKVKESLDGQDQVSKEIMTLDEQIMESIAKIKEIKTKRDFYQEFSKDPISFIKQWLSSQSQDLNELLGIEDNQKRFSSFYQNDWIHEAIKVYQLREFNAKVSNSIPHPHPQHPHQHQQNGSMGHMNPAVGGVVGGFGGMNPVGHGINHNMNPIRR